MTRLTPHFTLEEFTFSQTATRKGIDNTPHEGILDNLCILANGMEHVRNLLNAPIHVSSGYRCPELNDLLGSKRTSQHTKGLACDFTSNVYGSPQIILLILLPPIFLTISLFWSLIGGFISLSLKMAELLETSVNYLMAKEQ